jgi:hypothetical protein
MFILAVLVEKSQQYIEWCRRMIMRIKDAFISAIALVLSLSALTGLSYTEQFQQASSIEVGGFDALAHDLFDRTELAGGEMDTGLNGRSEQLAVSKQ